MHLSISARDPGSNTVLSHYLRHARAGNTWRTYAAQWQRFNDWCEARTLRPFPAEPGTIAAYLAARAQAAAAVASLNVALAAIAFAHRVAGVDFPHQHPTLAFVLEGIRRVHNAPQAQAEPLTGRLLGEVLASLGDSAADLRDAALLSLLYAFALRTSEVVALDWEELGGGRGWCHLADDRADITLLGSKACQRNPQSITVPVLANPRVFAAIRSWIARARIAPGEPLLRPLARGDGVRQGRLDAASVSGIVKRALARHFERTGLSAADALRRAARFSGHSGRVGLCVSASEADVPAQHIAALARHKSMSMVLHYTRQADRLRCAPHRAPGVGV